MERYRRHHLKVRAHTHTLCNVQVLPKRRFRWKDCWEENPTGSLVEDCWHFFCRPSRPLKLGQVFGPQVLVTIEGSHFFRGQTFQKRSTMLPTPALSPAMTPTSDCGSLGRGYLHGEAGESRETKSIALALPGTLEKNHLKDSQSCLFEKPACRLRSIPKWWWIWRHRLGQLHRSADVLKLAAFWTCTVDNVWICLIVYDHTLFFFACLEGFSILFFLASHWFTRNES